MKFFSVILIIALLIFVARNLRGWFTSRVEQPNMTVEKDYGSFVVVSLPPMIVATVITSGSLRQASSAAFRELAGFIFGDNISTTSVAMTAPVLTQKALNEQIAMTAPVLTQSSADDKYLVSFTMPSKWTMETLPVPNNDRITIVEQDSLRKAIWRFGGYAHDSRVVKQWDKFQVALAANNVEWSGIYTLAQYNDPFTPPWMRKNELWVDLVGE